MCFIQQSKNVWETRVSARSYEDSELKIEVLAENR
jgi:hypothetical protein